MSSMYFKKIIYSKKWENISYQFEDRITEYNTKSLKFRQEFIDLIGLLVSKVVENTILNDKNQGKRVLVLKRKNFLHYN